MANDVETKDGAHTQEEGPQRNLNAEHEGQDAREEQRGHEEHVHGAKQPGSEEEEDQDRGHPRLTLRFGGRLRPRDEATTAEIDQGSGLVILNNPDRNVEKRFGAVCGGEHSGVREGGCVCSPTRSKGSKGRQLSKAVDVGKGDAVFVHGEIERPRVSVAKTESAQGVRELQRLDHRRFVQRSGHGFGVVHSGTAAP